MHYCYIKMYRIIKSDSIIIGSWKIFVECLSSKVRMRSAVSYLRPRFNLPNLSDSQISDLQKGDNFNSLTGCALIELYSMLYKTHHRGKVSISISPKSLLECTLLSPAADLLNQKLHLSKIPGRLSCTLKCEKGGPQAFTHARHTANAS